MPTPVFPKIVITSLDGYTWTKKSSGTTVDLLSVSCGDSMFVAPGENGTILLSPEGETWTPESAGKMVSSIPVSSEQSILHFSANMIKVIFSTTSDFISYLISLKPVHFWVK